jgi:ABC-type glycerol-3-phosphate transport system substrate-binding protein
MKTLKALRKALLLGACITAVSFSVTASAQDSQMQPIKNVVLVHGAWADGSSWSKLIPFLQAKGLHVVVTCPLL